MDGIYEFIRSLWVVWLLLLFAGIVVYALWPGNRRKFSRAARIPLDDDEDLPGDDTTGKPPPDQDQPGMKDRD